MSDPLIKPFRGLLYNGEKIDHISRCVCPPYDVIPDASPYYEKSLFNAIRLELPIANEGMDSYGSARKTLEGWLAENILSFDDRESIYVYEQEFAVHGVTHRRTGIIPLVRLDKQRILTHEETRKKAREDRERLIERLGTFTSLVFAMYEDGSKNAKKLIEGAQKEKLYDFIDEFSIRNRFYRMTKTDEMARLASILDEGNLYIADGHHRLSVSFKLGLPYVAMYLTDMHDEGITILPYHRVVSLDQKQDFGDMLRRLEPYFVISKKPCKGEETVGRLIERISSSPGFSFLLYTAYDEPTLFLLEQKKAIDFDPGSHEILRRLRVNVVHSGVLKHLMGVRDEEISFLNEPDEAIALVNEGKDDFAVFVPATSVDEVKAIAENNLVMPPKSTYFYPKILTGLVFYKYG